MKTDCIFLDNNSSTELDPRVLEKYLLALKQSTGNSSSKHFYGWQSRGLYDLAKENIANLFGTTPECVVFTSGATEANNIVFLGLKDKSSYLSSRIEHSSVFESLNKLEENGHTVNFLEVRSDGLTIKDQKLINKSGLTSLHHANNEIGVTEDFTDFLKPTNAHLHTDASQSIGKLPLSFKTQPIDIITLSGHKIHSPKGIGALMFRSKDIKKMFSPIVYGGHHDEDLRPGTIPVALCVALSEAISFAFEELEVSGKHLISMTELFFNELKKKIKDLELVGPQDFSKRLPGLLSVSFPNIHSSELISNLATKVAFSSGSACRVNKSRVASEILKDENLVNGFSRFGISKFTKEAELKKATEIIISEYNRLKNKNV